LPSVSRNTPSTQNSDHPPASIHQGQAYVTALINAAMKSPGWNSTAIFLSWDDWGGFYDGAVPPAIDQDGYGLRVPGIVISPYARRGYLDHQPLPSDAPLRAPPGRRAPQAQETPAPVVPAGQLARGGRRRRALAVVAHRVTRPCWPWPPGHGGRTRRPPPRWRSDAAARRTRAARPPLSAAPHAHAGGPRSG